MRLYLASGSRSEIATLTDNQLSRVGLLVSYADLRKKKNVEEEIVHFGRLSPLFLDSGAFAVMNSGASIDVDEYIAFCTRYAKYFDVVAGLDVIGNAQATRHNIEYMESKGVKVLPTYHTGSDLTEVDRLLDKYEYIAIGGVAGHKRSHKTLQLWLDAFFARVMARTHTGNGKMPKVHGFGITSPWLVKRYPFYSVDSTSWKAGGRYGDTRMYHGGKLVTHAGTAQYAYKRKFRMDAQAVIVMIEEATRLWDNRGITWEN